MPRHAVQLWRLVAAYSKAALMLWTTYCSDGCARYTLLRTTLNKALGHGVPQILGLNSARVLPHTGSTYVRSSLLIDSQHGPRRRPAVDQSRRSPRHVLTLVIDKTAVEGLRGGGFQERDLAGHAVAHSCLRERKQLIRSEAVAAGWTKCATITVYTSRFGRVRAVIAAGESA